MESLQSNERTKRCAEEKSTVMLEKHADGRDGVRGMMLRGDSLRWWHRSIQQRQRRSVFVGLQRLSDMFYWNVWSMYLCVRIVLVKLVHLPLP